MIYSHPEFIGQGTLLDVTASGCRAAGTMPVAVGMQLRVWGGPPETPDAVYLPAATVVWVRGHEFGLAFTALGGSEQRWLAAFLAEALSLSLLRPAA